MGYAEGVSLALREDTFGTPASLTNKYGMHLYGQNKLWLILLCISNHYTLELFVT